MIRSPFSMTVDSDDSSGSSIINQIIYHGELSDIYAIQNASKSWLYGFETGLKVNLFDNFDFKTQYNYLKGEQRDMDSATPRSISKEPCGTTSIVLPPKIDSNNLELT